MYAEESSGGLGMFLVYGVFAITLIVGVALFVWFLKSQKSIAEKKKSEALPASGQSEGENLARRSSDRAAGRSSDRVAERAKVPAAGAAVPAAGATPKLATEVHEQKLPEALTKTRASLFGRIQSLFGARATLSDSEREDLEEVLYTADLGPKTVQDLLDHVFATLKETGETGFEAVRRELHAKMTEIFETTKSPQNASARAELNEGSSSSADDGLGELRIFAAKPAVLMVVGVNGAGKTTTIGKVSSKLAARGLKVLVAAGDTFRAAAGEQLKVWTDRAGGSQVGDGAGLVEIFDPANVTEPSAVAYQALEIAISKKFDVVIIDTAGRLHTQKNLMEELKKMKRVLAKLDPSAPHETLLVLDANSGQNALIQAKEFHGALNVDGVVLTKLDGSAKGGVAVGITNEVGLPIKLIGVGEKIGDLRPFDPRAFVDSILK